MEHSSILLEIILSHQTPSGKTVFKSDSPDYKIKMVKGKPTEVMDVQRHKYSKHRSQRLFKSPATRAKASLRMRATNLYKKFHDIPTSHKSEVDSYYDITNPTDIDKEEKTKRVMEPYKKGREILKKMIKK